MTPAQCRAARGLLKWNQDELASAAQVSGVTVRNFENEKSSPQRASLAMIRSAFESAGVEFTNGDQPGVRLRKVIIMTLQQFLGSLKAYERNRLQSKAIHIPGEQPKFGFVFVYGDRDFADLMFGNRALGRVEWRNGNVVFDPPLSRGQRVNTFEDNLDEWVSLAYARGLAAP